MVDKQKEWVLFFESGILINNKTHPRVRKEKVLASPHRLAAAFPFSYKNIFKIKSPIAVFPAEHARAPCLQKIATHFSNALPWPATQPSAFCDFGLTTYTLYMAQSVLGVTVAGYSCKNQTFSAGFSIFHS